MKILKLHIENYGGLHNADISFTNGINEIFEENGYGKTTLASFLKAMFYGLPPYRANTKDFNDRRKYYPFSGGKFGGNLEFEFNGDNYRIERFFGKKSETEDEIRIYKNADPSTELLPVPGFKIFGLDEESFLRTLFIDSEVADVQTTSVINGLLGDFASTNDNEASFDDALVQLETARKRYKAAKGNNDLITSAQTEISELKIKIENIEKESAALQTFYSELNGLTAREKELADEIKKASAKNVEAEKFKIYSELVKKAKSKEEELKAAETKFPHGIPEKESVLNIETLISRLEVLAAKRELTILSNDKKTRLQTYTRTFVNGIPSKEALLKLQNKLDEISRLNAELDKLKSDNERANQSVKREFSDFDAHAAQTLEISAQKYLSTESAAKPLLSTPLAAPKSLKGKTLSLAAFGAIAAIGIITAILFTHEQSLLISGIIAAIIGCVGTAISFTTLKTAQKENKLIENEQIAKQNARKELDLAADEMKRLLLSLGYNSPNGIMFDYAACKADIEDSLRARRESYERNKAISELTEKLKIAGTNVTDFFDKFELPSSDTLSERFFALKNAVKDYAELCDEQRICAENHKALLDEESQLKTEINAFFSRYGLLADGDLKTRLKSLETDLFNIEQLKKESSEATETAKNYKENNSINAAFINEIPMLDKLNDEFAACQKAIAVKKAQIADSESACEILAEYKNKEERAEEKLKEYKEKRATIALAEKFLKAAYDNMQQKYIAPIKDKFVEYAAPLESALGEKIIMNKDFKVFFERGGETRDDKHLSSGQRSILSLCFRLSLIDNAFKNEKPFIIMDDPFVNLDEAHIRKTLRFLQDTAKNFQIIYFCCHESRKIPR